jgi:hypothetical protein
LQDVGREEHKAQRGEQQSQRGGEFLALGYAALFRAGAAQFLFGRLFGAPFVFRFGEPLEVDKRLPLCLDTGRCSACCRQSPGVGVCPRCRGLPSARGSALGMGVCPRYGGLPSVWGSALGAGICPRRGGPH